ncbi:MAG: protein-L-isoaspartate O-methyltransferase [Gammaproteobacteria bacterium]|nr:protein-L-isoaspartate O-methyltransferase [Gammaproteobacteria bacterium]
MSLEKARFNMIEQQIRPWDVTDQRVLNALDTTHREDYVPQEYRQFAYTDTRIPLDETELMMNPNIEARMLQALQLQPTDKILEIGTGSGYITALLAQLSAHVYSMEISTAISNTAGKKLEEQGIENVNLTGEDGIKGWEDHAPYDAIAVTGSVPYLEEYLEKLLSIGGRMFVVVGESPVMEAMLITRTGESDWSRESLFETDIPALQGNWRKRPFVF